MKPLPAQKAEADSQSGGNIPSLPSTLSSPSGSFSKGNNRRSSSCPLHRAYPLLLASSTAIAAVFCLLYITKPVIVSEVGIDQKTTLKPVLTLDQSTQSQDKPLLPSEAKLPGDSPKTSNSSSPLRSPSSTPSFEETNLRIQHVLAAETPSGPVARIDIDVPVLYQSRNLRWTTEDVATARNLMLQLMEYQEKSRNLRAEGVDLLAAWQQLVNQSTPTTALRADSPSLPVNQVWAADAPLPSSLNTGNSVQLKQAGK